MQTLVKKIFVLSYVIGFIMLLAVLPLYGQKKVAEEQKQPFIKKGTVLADFSFSFVNGSRSDYNQDRAREVTGTSFQAEGLYFISERVAAGPFFNVGFTYRDLFNAIHPPDDIDVRHFYWSSGVKAAYYIPFQEIFGDGDSYLFFDGGLFIQYFSFQRETGREVNKSELGYQIGTGFLIPVGKQIAINTKLGFRSYRREYKFYNKEDELIANIQWPKELSLSLGLNVTF